MLPPSHPLIEAATKPLADNAEQRLAANEMLGETFDPGDSEISEHLTRLEMADGKRFPQVWRVCLHLCAMVAFLLLAFPSLRIGNSLESFRSLASYGYRNAPQVATIGNLTPDQQLLLGDPNLPEITQKELLHLSAPERADFYTEYAGKFESKFDRLPEDYLKITARIDPDNAFHLYNAAAHEGADSIEKLKSTTTKPPRYSGKTKLRDIPKESVWKIKDEAKFKEALDLIAKASSLPNYENYETSLAEARLPLFNQDRMIPRIQTLAYFAGQTTQVISIRKTADLISAQAYFLSLKGDKQGFLKLDADSEAFLAHLSRAPDSNLVGELVYAVSGSGTAAAFHYGAERLGLPKIAGKMRIRLHTFIDDVNTRALRENPISERIEDEGSMLSGLSGAMAINQVAHPPRLDPEIFTAGRMADYNFYSALLIPMLMLLIGLSALATFVSRSLLPRPVKVLSKRLDLLLRPVDWAWVAGAVIVPSLITLLVTRHTPLGGTDFNLRHNQMLFPAIHFLLIILLLLTIPPTVLRWRLGKRLGAFGLDNHLRLGSLVLPTLGCTALMLAHPLIEHFSIDLGDRAMAVLALLPALWCASILFEFCRMYFGKKVVRVSWAIALAALPTALSFAIILLAPLGLIFLESAEKWVAKDQLILVVPTAMSPYEAQIARQKRKETNAILGFQ